MFMAISNLFTTWSDQVPSFCKKQSKLFHPGPQQSQTRAILLWRQHESTHKHETNSRRTSKTNKQDAHPHTVTHSHTHRLVFHVGARLAQKDTCVCRVTIPTTNISACMNTPGHKSPAFGPPNHARASKYWWLGKCCSPEPSPSSPLIPSSLQIPTW